MKKVLLTSTMVFAFVVAQAKNDVHNVSYKSTKPTTSIRQETTTKVIKKLGKRMAMPTCYALSCGTVCGNGTIKGDIEDVFNALESYFCHVYMA